jgi:multidrug efflux pump subunit AcrA (membrane-fusion protein)
MLVLALLTLAAPPLVSTPAAPASGKQVQLTHCLVSLVEDVHVPALEAGALVSVAVADGQFVKQGQLLARIDDRQSQIDKLAAELQRDAALAKAQDDIEVRFSVAAQAVAAAELERALAIERRSPGGVTQQEIQKLQLAKHRDELQIEKSKLEMKVAKMNADVHQAAVQSADNDVARRQIIAPLEGLVVALLHEKGEWVAAGEAVVQVVRIDRLRVEGLLSAAEYDPAEIANRPVTVDVPLAGGRIGRFLGKVVFISPLVAAGNTYRVRAEVENHVEAGHPLLRPGMTATMTVGLEGVAQAPRILR